MRQYILLIPLLIAACASQPQGRATASSSPFGWIGPTLGVRLGVDNARAQAEYDDTKNMIENQAHLRLIGWTEAARQVRDLDKSFAGRRDLDTTWAYDFNDEEYHAFCIAAAALVDSKRISFDEYNAARTKRFAEIQTRRSAARQQARPTEQTCTTQITGTSPMQQIITRCY